MNVTVFEAPIRGAPRLHEPFLERASSPSNRFRSHALGAFLTLRALDRIIEAPRSAHGEATAYQLKACADYLDELHPQNEEVSHLREMIRVGRRALETRSATLLWSPLLAFAYWLEQQLQLDEALDVLDSALRVRGRPEIQERVAAHLQRGRVLRVAGRFGEATHAYATAGEIATLSGDRRSEMVSRIGRAIVMQKTGDLPGSQRELDNVMTYAHESGDTHVEALASHDLAVTMSLMDREPQAVALLYRAIELYEEEPLRLRALSDIGLSLKKLGHYSAARDAFGLVIGARPAPNVRINTALELMDLCALVGDRLGFERWRRDLERTEHIPVDERVDLEFKVGSSLAAFGENREALVHLQRALELARSARLGQRVFDAERAIEEVRAERAWHGVTTETPCTSAEVQGAIDGLRALVGTD